jgi:hypothetical protein
VIFDALPTQMLEDARGRIDAERYPSFARLADDATWYRNATTVQENTPQAVPAILDGKLPRKGKLPILADHPHNLFTLLAPAYRVEVLQDVTSLCSSELCEDTNGEPFADRMKLLAEDVGIIYGHLLLPDQLEDRLPSVSETNKGFAGDAEGGAGVRRGGAGSAPSQPEIHTALRFGRPERFRRAVAAIDSESRPTLNFMHVLLPHEPFQYLPSGRSYTPGGRPDPALYAEPSYDNQWLTLQSFQRHLLQTGYTDRVLGTLLEHLRQTGVYDRALIVVVADHGQSYRVKPTPAPPRDPAHPGFRREITRQNAAEVAPVPLLIKAPGQRRGRIDDRWARTVDILPTIADHLGIRLPFDVDGRSLRGPAPPPPEAIEVFKDSGPNVVVPIPDLVREKWVALRRQHALFGTGRDSLYLIGPHPELIGRRVSELEVRASPDARAEVMEGERLRSVDLRASAIPSLITGQIEASRPDGRDLAVALNGHIVATSRSFRDLGPSRLNFSSLAPETALRQGANRLQVFEVRRAGGRLRLESLARVGA